MWCPGVVPELGLLEFCGLFRLIQGTLFQLGGMLVQTTVLRAYNLGPAGGEDTGGT